MPALLSLAQLALLAAALQVVERVMVDRIVAVVDDDPILWSEVARAIALDLVAEAPGGGAAARARRALDTLIEQRLRQHEVARFESENITPAEVEAQLRVLAERSGGEAALDARLLLVGSDREQLRRLVAEQLRVLAFVEERLGARVFVDLDDIRRYYEQELLPELAARAGADDTPPPPLVEVQEQIREVVYQRRLNQELASWTQELRRAADVVDLLARPAGELPLRPVPPRRVPVQ